MASQEIDTIPYGDLQILSKIGSFGQAADIRKALWKTKDNLQVAVKIYTKGLSQKEAKILKKLDHVNVIKFYGTSSTDLASCMIMEYASNGDLFNYLKLKRKSSVNVANERLPRRQFINWSLDIASAIQYLHGQNITHKDIKSLNVLISDDIVHEEDEELLNRLKVCDFGISKETDCTATVRATDGGFSLPWAAPEVINDPRLVSQMSDIYSLCVVIWELWTCQQPWLNNSDIVEQSMRRHGVTLEMPADFPDTIKPMMTKCWQVERSKRCKINEVINYIKCLMSEWQSKDKRENATGNDDDVQRSSGKTNRLQKTNNQIDVTEKSQSQDIRDDQQNTYINFEEGDGSVANTENLVDVEAHRNGSVNTNPVLPLGDHGEVDDNDTNIEGEEATNPTACKNKDSIAFNDNDYGIYNDMIEVTTHGTVAETTSYIDMEPRRPLPPVPAPRKKKPAKHIYQNIKSPVPETDLHDDAYVYNPHRKSAQELAKLCKHVEESHAYLKRVKEDIIDKEWFDGVLNDGELKHFLINTADVEDMMSRFDTWFKQCKQYGPAVSKLIINILDDGYLHPMANFTIYSPIQLNILELLRHRPKYPENIKKAEHYEEDEDYPLSFTDLQAILLKQANWLKKFLSILKGFRDALILEKVEGDSFVREIQECCYRVDVLVMSCKHHKHRITMTIGDHITSLIHKLRFDTVSLNREEVKNQKSFLCRNTWVKKSGTIYIDKEVRQSKKETVMVPKKYTMIAFVSTVVIVEENGNYLDVLDCLHKKDLLLQGKDEGWLNEKTSLTKLHPSTRLPLRSYEISFESVDEIYEWWEVLQYSDEEDISQNEVYSTPLGIQNTMCQVEGYEDFYADYRPIYAEKSIYEDVEGIQILARIRSLNKKTAESLKGLKELYIENEALLPYIGDGESHHLYYNVLDVYAVIESFSDSLKTTPYDSLNVFTELRKHLESESFDPIVKYYTHIPFQKNILRFQFKSKHGTLFGKAVVHLEEKGTRTKHRVSEVDLALRLTKPSNWLAELFIKLKDLNFLVKLDPNHEEKFHLINEETLSMLQKLLQRQMELKEEAERESNKHITSVLLKLPIQIDESKLIKKLSDINDDWITKHDHMTMFTKKGSDGVALKKKRYNEFQVNIYATTSVLILTYPSNRRMICQCYDRNYADVEELDAASKESWMPDKVVLFKLWIYEKEGEDYNAIEYLLGLLPDRPREDLNKWKTALVVATGESGKFDNHTRPNYIVSETFAGDRDGEISLEVNDFVEVLEMENCMGKVWVKGKRRDGQIGLFPKDALGDEIDSEYHRGQLVKQRYRLERREKANEKLTKKNLRARVLPEIGTKPSKQGAKKREEDDDEDVPVYEAVGFETYINLK